MHVATPRPIPAAARRRFAATLAAAALALAGMTVAAIPARAADMRDPAAGPAALAALMLLAVAANDRRKAAAAQSAPPEAGPRRSPALRGVRGRTQPGICAIELRDEGPHQVVYGENCLRRSGIEGRLPRSCQQAINAEGPRVPVSPAGCLAEAGFRPEAGGR